MTLGEIAAILDGEVRDAEASRTVTGAAFLDSREPVVGGLFLAAAGEHTDGHRFAERAIVAGAAAVLGARPTGVPTVVVADVQRGVQALARHVLARLRRDGGPTVLAVTGSQGKTTVKDMIAAVLGDAGATVATRGSFNNEWGLPLTVLRADTTTRYLVLEMGARGAGHIAELCAVAPPDIAVVVNVGTAHLGEFGSRDEIAAAKAELVAGLAPHGIAVLNADDPRVSGMADRAPGRVVRFGTAPTADVRVDRVELDDVGRPTLRLSYDSSVVEVALRLPGVHQAGNAAAAAAAAVAVGLPLETIASSLSMITTLSPWRMELHRSANGLVVLNDAYNANPESTTAALETLAAIGARSGRRTVAVLGEMRELGSEGPQQHRLLGERTVDLGIDVVLVVGEAAAAIGEGNDTAVQVPSVDDAVAWLRENMRRSDVVLVKASRAVGLERVAAALVDEEDEG